MENNAYKLAVAIANKEVLVAFRVDIPDSLFDVIDSESGNFHRPLAYGGMVDQVGAAGRGPRFVHASRSQYSTVQIVYKQ